MNKRDFEHGMINWQEGSDFTGYLDKLASGQVRQEELRKIINITIEYWQHCPELNSITMMSILEECRHKGWNITDILK